MHQRLQADRRFWVICMMRDPRDVVVSRHGKKLEDYWAELDLWKEMLVHYRCVASHPRFITVRYEDLDRKSVV